MFVMQNFIKFTPKEMFPVLLLNYKPSDPLIDMPKYTYLNMASTLQRYLNPMFEFFTPHAVRQSN